MVRAIKAITIWSPLLMFLPDSDSETSSDSRIFKVSNLPKRVENQRGWVRKKPEVKHDETKLSQFSSQLDNLCVWIIHNELFWQLLWTFLTVWKGSSIFL